MPKSLKKLFILILIFSWIFSGWPQIFNFPPKVQVAQAITCGFGTDIGGGVCRSFLTTTGSNQTFTSPANSVALGTLSTSAVRSDSHTITVGTNATNGLTINVRTVLDE